MTAATPSRTRWSNLLDARHKRLKAVLHRLPGDYTDYGGTVERWAADSDSGFPDCSCGCRWAAWLGEGMGGDWCVCTNPKSHRAGLLTFEHQAGEGCFELAGREKRNAD